MARVVRLLFVDRLGISSVRHVLSKYNRVVAGGEADRLVMSQDDASLTATLSAAFELASSHNAASEKVLQMLSDVARAADALSVISPNDRLDEISTPALRMFLIPSLQADVQTRARIDPAEDRVTQRRKQVDASIGAARTFFAMVRRHSALPDSVVTLLRPYMTKDAQQPMAPADKRMFKIQVLKLEKAAQARLVAFRDAYRHRPTPPADVFYDPLVESGADDDDDTEMVPVVSATLEVPPVAHLRSYFMLLIVLHALRTANALESLLQEKELLQAPPMPEAPDAPTDTTWRLDPSWTSPASDAPLLSESGRPLRPFTIIPKREQLKSEVFRPSHRLPTMSIDEYLEEETRRGRILPSTDKDAPTPRAQRQVESEQDGTRTADEAEEAARQEAIYWDAYTESHRRGEGNTMNRG